jgi:integrase
MKKVRSINKGVLKTSDSIDLDILTDYLNNLDLTKEENLNFWLYCSISMKTGLRSVDILELKASSVIVSERKFKLREKKTRKLVEAPIFSNVLDKMDLSREYVIFNNKRKTLVSLMTINRRLKEIYKDSGLQVSSHSIRKATAKKVYEKTGNNIIKAMIFLNHSSPVMTKNYLGITKDEKMELYSYL